jgi:hypothetical protein
LIPDSQIMLHDGENNSVVTDETCAIHPSWNAAVWRGDIGRLNPSDNKGSLPGIADVSTRVARQALVAAISAPRPRPTAPEKPIALVRNGAAQLERIAPSEQDFVVQGRGCPLDIQVRIKVSR